MYIHVLPKLKFDKLMEKEGWNDNNVPTDKAFISICCLPNIKKNYLEDYKHIIDEHWFKENHPNVLNIDFDDITEEERETRYGMSYGMTDKDADMIVEFAKKNADKKDFYIHCMAGKSRSIGVGCALREFFNCKMSCFFGINGRNDFVYNKLKERL